MNIPESTQFSAEAILNLVQCIVMVRHGNAVPAPPEQDQHRELSEKGLDQARAIGEKISQYGPFDGVFSSPFVRTRRTAKVALQLPRSQVVNVSELAAERAGEGPDLLGEAFKELGHASLAEYFRHVHAHVVMDVGRAAATALLTRIYDDTMGDDPAKIAVFGHGVILPATLWAFGEMLADRPVGPVIQQDAILTTLGEAHAVVVRIRDNGQAVTIKCLKP